MAPHTVIAIRDRVRHTFFGCLDLRSRFVLAPMTPGSPRSGPATSSTSPWIGSPVGWTGCSRTTARSSRGSSPGCGRRGGSGAVTPTPGRPRGTPTRSASTAPSRRISGSTTKTSFGATAPTCRTGNWPSGCSGTTGSAPTTPWGTSPTPFAAFVRDHTYLPPLRPPPPVLATAPASTPVPGLIPPPPHPMPNYQIHWARTRA